MKQLVVYSTQLMDYEAWQPLPGAVEFEERYKPWAKNPSTFVFERDSPESQQAAAYLRRAGLKFHVGFEVELTAEEEATYPAFLLNAPGYYNIIDLATDPPRVKARELAGGMALDVGCSQHALTSTMRDGLGAFGIELAARPAVTTKRQQAWLVEQFPALPEPYEIPSPIILRAGSGKQADRVEPGEWDMQIRLSQANTDYLHRHHMGQTDYYRYQEKTYRHRGSLCLVSGQLAHWLRNEGGGHLQLTPLCLVPSQ